MVYQVTIHTTFFIFWILSLVCHQSKFSLYFNYITSLNYMDTNMLYLFIISLSLSLLNINLLVIVFKMILPLSLFTENCFFKSLLNSLIIGTILIHPIIFYFCLVIFFIKMYSKCTFTILLYLRIIFSNLLIFFFLTMFLGSLWATQSDSWGYFWVNDLVEWVLLLIIFLIVVSIHFFFITIISYNFFFIEFLVFTVIALIRLGFFSTRHNFISFSVSTYTIFFIYLYILKIFQSNILRLNFFYKFLASYWFKGLFLLLYFNFFIKFIFFIFFIFFFNKAFKYLKLLYFHYNFFIFSLIWVSPFIFFKVSNTWFNVLFFESGKLFHRYLYNRTLLFDFNSFYEVLNFVYYVFSFFKLYYVTNFQSNLLFILTNGQLIYIFILFWFIFRKMVWI